MSAPRVLVIGGSGNVGQATCRALRERGARLVLTYHRGEERGIALAEETGATALPLDVRSIPDLQATVTQAAEALGGLDALVLCAAVGVTAEGVGHPPVEAISEAAWDAMLDVNAKAAFFAVQALLPHLPEAGGNVVLLGSVDGIKPVPGPLHYAASKGAVSTLARGFAKELGPRGVKINCVAPGVLDGGLSATLPQSLRDEYLKHSGLGRFGTFDEVARLTAWLATENTYLTGQSLVLDGGL